MLQKASNEPLRRQRAEFRLLALAVPVAKGHLVVRNADEPVGAQRDSENLWREVLERCLPTPDWPTIDYPRLAPCLTHHLLLQLQLPQTSPHLAPEQLCERFGMHQELALRRNPTGTIRCERASRHEVVDVRMVAEIACSGLQHTDHADLPTQETLISGELLQGRCRTAEEQ